MFQQQITLAELERKKAQHEFVLRPICPCDLRDFGLIERRVPLRWLLCSSPILMGIDTTTLSRFACSDWFLSLSGYGCCAFGGA